MTGTLTVDVASYETWDTSHQYPFTYLFAGDTVTILAETAGTITITDGVTTATIPQVAVLSKQPTVRRN